MLARVLRKKGNAILLMAFFICLLFDTRAMATAVTIVSPATGSTVSGMVTITLVKATGTSWCNVYVDGVYQNATPPSVFYWQSSGGSNGSQNMSATDNAT